jgi:hypothetical protein
MAVAEPNMEFANKIVKSSALLVAIIIISALIFKVTENWSYQGAFWIPLKILPFLFFPYLSLKKVGRSVLLNVLMLWMNIFVFMGFLFKYFIWLFL